MVSRTRAAAVVTAVIGLFLTLVLVAPVANASPGGVSAAARSAVATEVDNDPVLTVNSVDARDVPMRISGWLVGGDADRLGLSIDGESVTPTFKGLNASVGRRSDVIAVVDNAKSLGNGTVQLAKSALDSLMPGSGASDRLGVMSAGGTPMLVQGLTSDPAAVRSSLTGVIPDGLSQTWVAVERAAELLGDGPSDNDTAIVLIAGSQILSSSGDFGTAVAELRRSGVELHVVAMPGGVDAGALAAAVEDVGGTFTTVQSDEELDAALDRVSAMLAGRFTITAEVPAKDLPEGSVVPLTVELGDLSSTVAYAPGSVRTGAAALAPIGADGGSGGGLMSSPIVKWFAVLLIVTALIGLFWAAITLILPDEHNLVKRLEVYEDPYGENAEPDEDPLEGHTTVPIIRRAVELTEDLADKRGLTENLEFKLEQANIPLRAAEGVFFAIAGSVASLVLIFVFTRNLLFAIVAAALCIMVPKAMLDISIRRRQKAFVRQLPDMLALLSGTLRAGYSISQGFESVSTEIDEPMGRELRRVVSEARLGRPLEEALESVAERMNSDDFSWAVMAIRIQREVGGNLAELLMTVADTMTERERLRRDVSTLTAEGRMSAIVIGILPPALSAVMFVMNPEYIKQLFSPGLGYMLVVMALISMGIGFVWMRKTVAIEV